MIPVSLYLKNFMSYGENVPQLDFREFSLACLCGNNGNGKSAIIDAIVWALWGEGRKASSEKKPDDGLLRTGQTDMVVDFRFDLEGDHFKVIRKYSKSGKKNSSLLEFEVMDQETGQFKNLTEKNISLTQGKINKFLRMDYEAFINTSVIIQGKADKFATKTASERKQLLSDILGLSRYDDMSERAKDKYKEADAHINVMEQEKGNLEIELTQKYNVIERLNIIKDELLKLNSDIESTEKKLSEMKEEKVKLTVIKEQVKVNEERIKSGNSHLNDLKNQRSQIEDELHRIQKILNEEDNILREMKEYKELQEKMNKMFETNQKINVLKHRKINLENRLKHITNEISGEVKLIEEKIKSIENQLSAHSKIIANKDDIEKGYKYFLDLEKKSREFEENFKLLKSHEDKKIKLEQVITKKDEAFRIELAKLQNSREELEKKIKIKYDTEKQIEVIKKEIQEMDVLEKEKIRLTEEEIRMKSIINNLDEKIKDLEKELQKEREKWKNIDKITGSICPVCEAPFDEERKIKTQERIKKEAEDKKGHIKKLKQEIEKSKLNIKDLLENIKQKEEQIKKLQPKQNILAQKQFILNDIKKSEQIIEEVNNNIKILENNIKEKKYAENEIKELNSIKIKIREIKYDDLEDLRIKGELKSFLKYNNLKIQLDMAMVNTEKLNSEIPPLENMLKEKRQIIEKEDFSHDIRAELVNVNHQLLELHFSQEEYDMLRNEIEDKKSILTRLHYLEDSKKQYPVNQKKLSAVIEKIKEKEAEVYNLEYSLKNTILLLGELPALEEEIPLKESYLYSLRVRLNELTGEKGNLESLSQGYKKYEERLKVLTEKLEKKFKDREIYKILQKAFGKDGIQALIIQNSIPEIETEANRLLARLTDNRIHISLELLRDKKSGGMKETLDIKISDETGTRDYELYSGGEAFRTNFSLRVALAKLLARRAGTKLRTLIIDEGFGTQDAEGLEYLVQAIQEIKNDFDKIIIITHLESLKNVFPTRIEISKTPGQGSNYRIIHN